VTFDQKKILSFIFRFFLSVSLFMSFFMLRDCFSSLFLCFTFLFATNSLFSFFLCICFLKVFYFSLFSLSTPLFQFFWKTFLLRICWTKCQLFLQASSRLFKKVTIFIIKKVGVGQKNKCSQQLFFKGKCRAEITSSSLH